MELLKNEVNGLENFCELFVKKDELDVRVAEELNGIKSQVKMPGFRPGHVPLNIIAKNYGYLARKDAVKKIIEAAIGVATKGKEIVAAFKPDAEIISDDENGLKISVKFEEMPQIELKDLSNLVMNKYKVKVADSDVDDYLNEILSKEVNWCEADDEHKAVVGDKVDVELTAKGNGSKKKRLDIEKEVMSFIVSENDGVEGHLNGLHVGSESDFEIGVNSEIAKIHVRVLKIYVSRKYKLDDEFLAYSGFENVEKLKNWAKERIEAKSQSDISNVEKKQLLDYLNSVYSFDVPSKMLDFEFNSILRQIRAEADREGKKLSPSKMPKVEEECKDIALRRVRLGLVISKIAKDEKISVTQDELRYAMLDFARLFPGKEKEVISKYSNDPTFISSLAGPILERKVVSFIEQKYAKLNDVEITTKELLELDSEFFDCYEDDEQEDALKPKVAAENNTASSDETNAVKKTRKACVKKDESEVKSSTATKKRASKKKEDSKE